VRVLYLEPFSGISGDMLLGALVDLGVPIEVLRAQVEVLGLTDRVTLEVRRLGRGGVVGTKVDVRVDGEVEGPADSRPEGEEHQEGHGQAHGIHAAGLLERLADSRLEPAVRRTALRVFTRLIEAEARVHGTEPAAVHLHEVGALDALIDVVGAVAGVDWLAPERILSAPPREGWGQTRSAHGVLPVPAPATAYLLEGVPLERIDVPFELVTPTGAALLVTLCEAFTRECALDVERVGYGAGTRELAGRPNLLRATLGEAGPAAGVPRDQVAVVETVVDDLTPELWPHLIERLLEQGARDAWLTPVIMKKGRPGVALTVLADPARSAAIQQLIFAETGTLGLRVHTRDRVVLPRARGRLTTPLGVLDVKLSRLAGETTWRVHPEYEACRALALQRGIPLREVYAAVGRAAGEVGALHLEEEERP
jgi:uncharacterized protein (TIGR00299 family) protein